MGSEYILALDAGTTSSRAILFDHEGRIAGMAQQEFPQIYPEPGWVEHNPMEIWGTQSGVAREVLNKTRVKPNQIAAIGITNQRETAILWDRNTGKPIMNGIVWQDRRTAGICEQLKKAGLSGYIKENTGLVIDAYFSATKVKWMLDNVPGSRVKAEKGDILFGTVDTWLIWNLTGGEVHVTDYSNASRTLMFNIKSCEWDDNLLREMNIPRAILPEVRSSSCIYGHTVEKSFGGARIPVASAIGDQQGALFGQGCSETGMVKSTYGTGNFILMNTGSECRPSSNGLTTTIAWGLSDRVEYALEGSVFIAGAAVQWLRDELKIVADASDTDYFARKVDDTNGVYMVPAFTGLGAPYWDQYARGAIVGLTRGANRDHIIRATLESIAYQTRDVMDCLERDSGVPTAELRVDGGACRNDFLMQFQSDILGIPVLRPTMIETTALGAAFLAGLAVGFWKDKNELNKTFELDKRFEPAVDSNSRVKLYSGWLRAVQKARSWELEEQLSS